MRAAPKFASGLDALAWSILLVGVLIADFALLGLPVPHLMEGDALIHLVFARNMTEGRPFEYGLGQPSRGGTSLLWEVLLAMVGKLTRTAQHGEAFVLATRITSGACLLIFGWAFVRVLGALGLRRRAAVLVTALCVAHPVVFYWTVANPMETALTLVLVAGLVAEILPPSVSARRALRSAFALALFTFALLLARPELSLLAGLAAVVLPWHDVRPRRWRTLVATCRPY